MKLTHHHHAGWRFIRTQEYTQGAHKPNGLWLSVDDDWRRWCEIENYGIGDHETEFRIAAPEKVLTITNADELRAFTAEWMASDPIEQYRWEWQNLVDAGWSGIMIAPYIWECRLLDGTAWYYSWDVASACIWDLSILEEVK